MKLAFFDTKSYDIPGFDRYGIPAGVEIKYFEANLNRDTAALAAGFDAVCVFVNDTVDAVVVDKLYSLGVKAIVLRCAGFNNVDIKACEGKLRVFRVPAYSPHAVAEHAMALLLTINRRTHKAYIRTRFADICKGFGMKILAYDKFPNPNAGLTYVDLPELFAQSDIISLHCPLTEETHHLINDETIAMMKKGVTIINTSRGALVDTEALINGIKEKKVGAACLDVYEEEGDFFYEDFSGHIVQDDKLVRLIAMPNVIVTSHQAFLTSEALDNIAATTVNNLTRFFSGDPDTSTEVVYSK